MFYYYCLMEYWAETFKFPCDSESLNYYHQNNCHKWGMLQFKFLYFKEDTRFLGFWCWFNQFTSCSQSTDLNGYQVFFRIQSCSSDKKQSNELAQSIYSRHWSVSLLSEFRLKITTKFWSFRQNGTICAACENSRLASGKFDEFCRLFSATTCNYISF